MILSVHQPQYLPWLGYLDKIARSDKFVFLDQVQYKPREYQNRNRIRTKEGPLWLSVPVVSKGLGRQNIAQVEIDNEFPWARKHLAAIRSCYGGADFFHEYAPFFEEAYSKKWDRLLDLNIDIIKYLLGKLKIETPLLMESDLGIDQQRTDRIVQICQKLKADTYLSGAGGKNYLEEDKFRKAGIELVYQEFAHPVYNQQFMKDSGDFAPYMSAIDLLFNEGPRSRGIIRIK